MIQIKMIKLLVIAIASLLIFLPVASLAFYKRWLNKFHKELEELNNKNP